MPAKAGIQVDTDVVPAKAGIEVDTAGWLGACRPGH